MIDDDWRTTVCFMTRESGGKAVGTGFFVNFRAESDSTCLVPYLVTAAHVARLRTIDAPLMIRVATSTGARRDVAIPNGAWCEHPDSDSTDVAVAQLDNSQDIDAMGLDAGLLVSDAFLTGNNISCGQEVFFIGLFHLHSGKKSNQPVFRFGHIALMANKDEPIHASLGPNGSGDIEAYLIESHSWGGASGSPVFTLERGGIRAGQYGYVLGMVQGHWNINSDVRRKSDGGVQSDESVAVNSGFAVVVPARKILETLTQDDVKTRRAIFAERHREALLEAARRSTETPTSLGLDRSTESQPTGGE